MEWALPKRCLDRLTHTSLYSDASLLITHINSECESSFWGKQKKITNKTTQKKSVRGKLPNEKSRKTLM